VPDHNEEVMTFIIAELGASHCGNLDIARNLVTEAAKAGADAFKLQTFNPLQMSIPNYKVEGGPWAGKDLQQLYKKVQTPRAWHPELFQLIRDSGMIPVGTPFHPDDVKFLETLNCPVYKIASFEATYLELLDRVCETGKPIFISTGQINNTELDIISTFTQDCDVTFMHCVSDYPTDMSQANLKRIGYLQSYGSVGISDHSKGVGAAPLAVALGAVAVEKHIQQCPVVGEDRGFALLPHQFEDMVKAVRQAELAIKHRPLHNSSSPLRRGVWCVNPKKVGEVYTDRDLIVTRPWSGVSPIQLDDLIGTKCTQDHEAWTAPR
jgi:sialic acid synthase SpsE